MFDTVFTTEDWQYSCASYLLTYLLTYLLAPRCRVLLEKLTGLQLVKKFLAFHGTRRYITALTSIRHLSLTRASPIRPIYPHLTFWRSIIILSTHLRLGLPSGLLLSGFPIKTLYTPSPHPYVPHAQPISFFSILSPAQYWVRSVNHLAPRYAISSISYIFDTVFTTEDWQYSCTSYKRKFDGNHFSRPRYVRNDMASHSCLHP